MAGLTALAVARAKAKDKPYKLSDQGGLCLLIKSSGKYWWYNYRFAGKRKTLAVGVYPEVQRLFSFLAFKQLRSVGGTIRVAPIPHHAPRL